MTGVVKVEILGREAVGMGVDEDWTEEEVENDEDENVTSVIVIVELEITSTLVMADDEELEKLESAELPDEVLPLLDEDKLPVEDAVLSFNDDDGDAIEKNDDAADDRIVVLILDAKVVLLKTPVYVEFITELEFLPHTGVKQHGKVLILELVLEKTPSYPLPKQASEICAFVVLPTLERKTPS